MARSKAYGFNPVAEVVVVKDVLQGDGVIKFGEKNAFPNHLIDLVDTSGTATSCLAKIATFVEADGLNDQSVGKTICSETSQTFDDIISVSSNYVSYFDCCSLLVTYSEDGRHTYVEVLPFQTIRKTPQGFIYNKHTGLQGCKKSDDIFIPEFKKFRTDLQRKIAVQNQIEEWGEQRGWIVYEFDKRPGKDIYPIPKYWAGVEDIESDAGLQKTERRNILKGFKASVIISMVGRLDDKTEDEAGKTEKDYQDDAIQRFTGADADDILVLESETKEGLAQVNAFPVKDMLDGIDKARDRVARAVCRHFEVPPVLVGLTQPEGLGNSQAMRNAMELFKLSVIKRQNLITRALTKIYGNAFDFTISSLNVMDSVPEEVLSVMTEDEKRALGGLAPVEESIINKIKSIFKNVRLR